MRSIFFTSERARSILDTIWRRKHFFCKRVQIIHDYEQHQRKCRVALAPWPLFVKKCLGRVLTYDGLLKNIFEGKMIGKPAIGRKRCTEKSGRNWRELEVIYLLFSRLPVLKEIHEWWFSQHTVAPPSELRSTLLLFYVSYFENVFRQGKKIAASNITRSHRSRSTTYVDAAYCYWPSSVVCLSVCLSQ